ncbi:MAG: hypothetical protein ACEY3J_03330 [Arsenophonus sp.]
MVYGKSGSGKMRLAHSICLADRKIGTYSNTNKTLNNFNNFLEKLSCYRSKKQFSHVSIDIKKFLMQKKITIDFTD